MDLVGAGLTFGFALPVKVLAEIPEAFSSSEEVCFVLLIRCIFRFLQLIVLGVHKSFQECTQLVFCKVDIHGCVPPLLGEVVL